MSPTLSTPGMRTSPTIFHFIKAAEQTIKRRTVEMQKKGLLQRIGGKRNGKWIVLKIQISNQINLMLKSVELDAQRFSL